MHTHATTDSEISSHDHGDSLKTYFVVFGALLVLLFMTYGAYFIPFEKVNLGEHNLGWVNTAIALLIASVKAGLVVVFFMHLRHATRLTWVTASAGLVFLSIMVLFTFADYTSRSVAGNGDHSVRESTVTNTAGTHADGAALARQPMANQMLTPGW